MAASGSGAAIAQHQPQDDQHHRQHQRHHQGAAAAGATLDVKADGAATVDLGVGPGTAWRVERGRYTVSKEAWLSAAVVRVAST